MPNPPCPYCATELHLNPSRKVTCRHCGESVRWRRRGVELCGRHLVTEREARACDAFSRMREQGVTAEAFRSAESNLTARFGFAPDPGDVVWSSRTWASFTSAESSRASNSPEAETATASLRFSSATFPVSWKSTLISRCVRAR